MSREIKFRAWNGEQLRDVNTIGWTNGELDWIDTSKNHGPIDEDIKFMQYTGLKDKNGVEIYEGDILRRYNNAFDKSDGYEIFTVKYQAFGYQLHVINNGKITNNIKYWSVYHANKEDEVIGNIYENKNLLEEK